MKTLKDCKDEIHSCSKCGLCQSVCPIYKITGNDCTVSRGQFIMLKGMLKGELKMSGTINRYLDLCLKCGACTKFCPSGIDVVDIIALAKAEYFKSCKAEKIKTLILKIGLYFLKTLKKLTPKRHSKTFEKKVIFFDGCGGINADSVNSVIKIFNSMNMEVIIPEFECCGFPFFVSGDMQSFKEYADKFYKAVEGYENYDIVTNCATCEKTLKSYSKWFSGKELVIKNIFDYIRENNLHLELKKKQKVTYHKPCNLNNMENVKWVLENTKNLEYDEMNDFDKCCGFEGVFNPKEYRIATKLFKEKYDNINSTEARIVLTSCLACKITLGIISWGKYIWNIRKNHKYKVHDFVEFLAKNVK